jgi:hypothetical protein
MFACISASTKSDFPNPQTSGSDRPRSANDVQQKHSVPAHHDRSQFIILHPRTTMQSKSSRSGHHVLNDNPEHLNPSIFLSALIPCHSMVPRTRLHEYRLPFVSALGIPKHRVNLESLRRFVHVDSLVEDGAHLSSELLGRPLAKNSCNCRIGPSIQWPSMAAECTYWRSVKHGAGHQVNG